MVRIRLGILLNDLFAPRWVHETMEQLLCAESVEVAVIVLNDRPTACRLQPPSILFSLWRWFDRRVFRSDVWAPELRTYAVQTLKMGFLEKSTKRTLSETELVRLRACNLDVLVQFDTGDLPDELLNCAKYGIWFFDYGERTEAKDEVALFWNLNADRHNYELLLRASTGNPRRDWVLSRRIFLTHLFSLEYNLKLDCRRRAEILLQRLSDLYREGWASIIIGEADGSNAGRRIDSSLLNRVTVSWLIRSLRRLFARACFQEQWILAYRKTKPQADTEQTVGNSFTVVLPPRGQNYADPFPFEHKGRTYIFFEQFADDGPGIISCTELYSNGTLGESQPVLKRDYHLSYPFLFEWRGDIYLLPETWANRTVEVYGAVDFPRRWELAGVLLRNVTAVDPTILEHNGKLCLFAAGLGGPGTEWSELSLFFAESLFLEWHSHPKNPIVRDVRRARPAGRLFFQNGHLIRPGQDCSQGYGHAISFNRVDVLSETDYREIPVGTVLPNWMPRLCATHTFNQQGDYSVLDGKVPIPRWLPVCSVLSPQSRNQIRGLTF
jgi:hypothetical protein